MLMAPRNSLELPVERLSYYAMHNNIPYTNHMKQFTSKKSGYPSSSPVKQLIDEEISKPKDSRHNLPSVVARLMGMDVVPIDKESMIQGKESKMENTSKNIARKEKVEAVDPSIQSSVLNPKLMKKSKMHFLPHIKKQDADEPNRAKRVLREHPQEEQLQKFKKEFEAWQASKIQKLSRSAEIDENGRKWKNYQTLAQENLSMEKMAHYANPMRNSVNRYSGELTCYASPATVEMNTQNVNSLQHYGYRNKLFERNSKEHPMNRSVTTDYGQFPQKQCDFQCNRSSVPTRIVILKPGLERGFDTESWPGSSEIVEDDCRIEDFLEEVKQRLRLEIQRNIHKDNRVGGAEIETTFHERLISPKEIAQHVAKQARESVTKDLEINLVRSSSTQSYTNEIQFDETDSPEFLNRDTRRLLSERLKNVLRNELDLDIHRGVSAEPITSMVDGGNRSPGLMEDMQENGKRLSQWEYMEDEHKTKLRSCRHAKDEAFASGEVSPRNLVRSLSTPVSGTAFGKLLLEERHLLTGAHIRRKHEAADKFSKEQGKNKKERLSFRGRVLKLRHNLTLKGMLFGKKIQEVKESGMRESECVEASITLPTVLMNPGSAQENSTEVPPSPASVCSSNHEDFYRPGGHPSPISPLDIPSIEDQPATETFSEIFTKINELRRQLDQIRSDGPWEEAPAGHQHHSDGLKEAAAAEDDELDPEADDLEGPEHVYLKDVLVTAGFYDDRFSNPSNSIDAQVHEKVEEFYNRHAKEDKAAARVSGGSNISRRILFDLLNESLSTISKPMNRSRLMRQVLGGATALPRGNKLLGDVWKMVSIYVCPPTDTCQSLDDMVASDLGKTFWYNDETDAIGSELESMIVGDLIEETMRDMVSSHVYSYTVGLRGHCKS